MLSRLRAFVSTWASGRRTVAGLVLVLAVAATGRAQSTKMIQHDAAVAGEYIVVLNSEPARSNETRRQARRRRRARRRLERELQRRFRADVMHRFDTVIDGYCLRLSRAQAERLSRDPRVAYVEENATVSIRQSSNWGTDRLDQRDLPLDSRRDFDRSGLGSHIYVIDTGIRSSHQELAGRVGPGFTIFNDGIGTEDCNGHGTHVAGIAAGQTNGVAPASQVYPVRVMSCSGTGSVAGVIDGIEWVTNNHVKPAVANMSLGGGASPSMDAAIRASVASGVTYVVAAGNDSGDACLKSPARVPEALTIGSTTRVDVRSSFSNVGACVDMFAPGSSIYSAWHDGDRSFRTLSGTSMASPHVAGVAALVLEGRNLTPSTAMSEVLDMATRGRLQDLGGSPDLLAFGVVDAPRDPRPSAAFTFACAGTTCDFDGSSSGGRRGITEFLWDFGDGATARGVTTRHVYADSRFAEVTLTVVDALGETDEQVQFVPVSNLPVRTLPLDVPPAGFIMMGSSRMSADGDRLTVARLLRQEGGLDAFLFLARSFDGGDSWTPGEIVHQACRDCPNASQEVADIEHAGDEIYVLARWHLNSPLRPQAVLHRSLDDGGSWTTVDVPLPEGRSMTKAHLVIRGDEILVVGTVRRSGEFLYDRLFVSRSPDQGETWSAPREVYAYRGGLSPFAISPENGVIHAVIGNELTNEIRGPSELRYLKVDARSLVVSANRQLCERTFVNVDAPRIQTEGRRVRVAALAGSIGDEEIHFTRSDDAGATFSSCQPVERAPMDHRVLWPTLQGIGDDLVLVAMASSGAGPDFVHWRSPNGGTTWGPPKPLRVGPERPFRHRGRSSGSRHHLLWDEWNAERTRLSVSYVSVDAMVGRADLTIHASSWASTGEEGWSVPLEFRVENVGSALLAGGYTNRLYVDGAPAEPGYEQYPIHIGSDLAPGESETATLYWSPVCGTHELSIRADDLDERRESNEDNNVTPTHVVNVHCPPQMVSPVPGGVLPGDEVLFEWIPRSAIDWYFRLHVGSAPGKNDYYDSGPIWPARHHALAYGLPRDGSDIFVRLYYYASDGFHFADYRYIANGGPTIVEPGRGTTLRSSTQSFRWSAHGKPVSRWWLLVGASRGTYDHHLSFHEGSVTEMVVNGLPMDGATAYVRLFFQIGSDYYFSDVEYRTIRSN